MNSQTLDQLKKYNIGEDKEKKIEYFFYTNTAQKAEIFGKALEKLGYEVKHGVSAGNKKEFVITGWTTKMKMSLPVVSRWSKLMCELGYKYDCEFDGWGTDVN